MVTKGGWRDTITGAIVVSTAAVLFAFVYGKDADPNAVDPSTYTLVARFSRSDGISVGSPVRMSGVPVGRVVAQSLDPQFRAVTTLRIAAHVQLTADTAAAIQTDGLLGAKHIELQPGADDAMLKPGAEIAFTQDAMVIDELLDKIIQQARAKRGFLDKPVPSTAN